MKFCNPPRLSQGSRMMTSVRTSDVTPYQATVKPHIQTFIRFAGNLPSSDSS